MSIYKEIVKNKNESKCQLAILIDPEHTGLERSYNCLDKAIEANVDYLFFGGSLIEKQMTKELISYVKSKSDIPCILFPGTIQQIEESADALLYLSLISGRNSDYLIGRHVESAGLVKNSNLEVLSTGYMLIDGGKNTAVNYMSNTSPIPRDKNQIAVATAIAGEFLGLKLIYLEAGSGADKMVPFEMIQAVSKNVSIPIIVGGGISNSEDVRKAILAGANLIVIGTAIEKNPDLVYDISLTIHSNKINIE